MSRNLKNFEVNFKENVIVCDFELPVKVYPKQSVF